MIRKPAAPGALSAAVVLVGALATASADWSVGRDDCNPAQARERTANGAQPQTEGNRADDFETLLERLRQENPGEYDKVKLLAETDRDAALRFLCERFRKGSRGKTQEDKKPDKDPGKVGVGTKQPVVKKSPARVERFERIETIEVGEFSIDLCRRDDGAFGLGEIRRGKTPLRRADFLITWQIAGRYPAFKSRSGMTVLLGEPEVSLEFVPERRECVGTELVGFRIRFQAPHGPIVETASWELGGSTRGLTYFDGYRGWHAPPGWLPADAVPETNPKLMPSLLHGTGYQFEHDPDGALLVFHTNPGDRLRNVSRGEAIEFETTFHGPTTIDRYVFVLSGDSRINLWSRAYETVHAELRRALDLPERSRAIFLQWPEFSRKGFRETARECAAATARDGFTGASIDVIWDNLEFHGGAKNMNIWDFSVCDGYGGESGLRDLIAECRRHNLLVVAWVPTAHLVDASPVWKEHPEWLLRMDTPSKGKGTTGPVYGDIHTGFHDYFRDRVAGVIRKFGLDGIWLDSHLPYAGQPRDRPNSAKLAAIYRDFIRAGARHLNVEGDASAIGSYGIGIGDDWLTAWGKVPDPELFYGSTMMCGSIDPDFYRRHFRRYVASGAVWTLSWDFLYSSKLSGDDFDAARREVRQVIADYRRVKDRMVHRFVHADGSGYTWTNDRDDAKVVWLLADSPLPDSRPGKAGRVYVID